MNLIIEESKILAEASFNSSKEYRYSLKRSWDENKPKVLYILLNPSKADHLISDLTFQFCMNYAVEHGFGQMEIVNLFAIRVTDSKELTKKKDPIGNENNKHILRAVKDADLIIAGWGSKGKYLNRDKKVLNLLLA